jgi:large subunit ribosomal protein L13
MIFKTYTPKKQELTSTWYLIDAEGKTLGRLASLIAEILRGKHKPTYTPNLLCGDHVVVINAAKIKVTGNKLTDKVYTRYSGYPGGLKRRNLKQAISHDPTFPLYHAVYGMLGETRLRKLQMKRLKVYAGPEHSHQAQKPIKIDFDEHGNIRYV